MHRAYGPDETPQKMLDMTVTTAGTLIGMAHASAVDTNKHDHRAQSWRCADRNLIDANRDVAFLA
jgi:hypothetical protein